MASIPCHCLEVRVIFCFIFIQRYTYTLGIRSRDTKENKRKFRDSNCSRGGEIHPYFHFTSTSHVSVRVNLTPQICTTLQFINRKSCLAFIYRFEETAVSRLIYIQWSLLTFVERCVLYYSTYFNMFFQFKILYTFCVCTMS